MPEVVGLAAVGKGLKEVLGCLQASEAVLLSGGTGGQGKRVFLANKAPPTL